MMLGVDAWTRAQFDCSGRGRVSIEIGVRNGGDAFEKPEFIESANMQRPRIETVSKVLWPFSAFSTDMATGVQLVKVTAANFLRSLFFFRLFLFPPRELCLER
jgi:hypothetical protein